MGGQINAPISETKHIKLIFHPKLTGNSARIMLTFSSSNTVSKSDYRCLI